MPKTWEEALTSYCYPITKDFDDAIDHPGWRKPDVGNGDHAGTKSFEDYFRQFGPNAIEPWAEVVFWKMASQRGRANIRTREVLDRWKGVTRPETLWNSLANYLAMPSKRRFDDFRLLFGFKTNVIAIVATFPAFAKPELFPMVDTRIAKWVRDHSDKHNLTDPSGPRLVPTGHERGLSMTDFGFMQHWTDWCRYTSRKLYAMTGTQWRARDVEMAIFQAQGDSRYLSPLPPLASVTVDQTLTPLQSH